MDGEASHALDALRLHLKVTGSQGRISHRSEAQKGAACRLPSAQKKAGRRQFAAWIKRGCRREGGCKVGQRDQSGSWRWSGHKHDSGRRPQGGALQGSGAWHRAGRQSWGCPESAHPGWTADGPALGRRQDALGPVSRLEARVSLLSGEVQGSPGARQRSQGRTDTDVGLAWVWLQPGARPRPGTMPWQGGRGGGIT